MCRKISFLPIAFFWLLLVTGCGAKDEKDEVNPKAKYYVYAEIEGVGPFRFETNDDDKNFTFGSSQFFSLFIYPEEYSGMTFWGAKPVQGKSIETEVTGAEFRKNRFKKFTSGLSAKHGKTSNGKISVTEVTDSIMEGTFAFDVYTDDDKGNEKISIRNGKFRVKY